jgi:hypothetical protein
VVSAAACVLVVFAVGSASAAKPVLSGGRAKAPLCDRSATGWPAYHWPVKPFDRQHPIRGAFGDPRTLVTGDLFGQTGPGLAGAYSFHNGVDIVAAPGTAVYPVVSGRVVVRSQDKIVVRTDDGRAFQYMHLDGAVHLGQTVVAERTILGWIRPGTVFEHVHLGEIDAGPDGLCRIHNPLDPGHLEPYQDHTTPRATGLYLDNGHGPYPIDGPIRPQDRLVVAAADPPASRLPGGWFGLPQAPALVEWRLLHAGAYTPGGSSSTSARQSPRGATSGASMRPAPTRTASARPAATSSDSTSTRPACSPATTSSRSESPTSATTTPPPPGRSR